MTFRQAKTLLRKRNLVARDVDGDGNVLVECLRLSLPPGVAFESFKTTQEIRTRVAAFVEDMKRADLEQLLDRHQRYFVEAGPAVQVWCTAMRKDRVWADLDFVVIFTKMIGAAKLEVYTKKLANGQRRKGKGKNKHNNKPQLLKRELDFQDSHMTLLFV